MTPPFLHQISLQFSIAWDRVPAFKRNTHVVKKWFEDAFYLP